jgi:plastocyanin
MKKLFFLTFLLSIIIFISGCSLNQNQPIKTPPPQAANETKVIIKNLSFNPPNLTIKTSTTVTWINEDTVTHTVTADNGLFNYDLETGQSSSFTFGQEGTVDYHCSVHPSMKGKIIVEK